VLENDIKIIGQFVSDLGELYKIAPCSKGDYVWNTCLEWKEETYEWATDSSARQFSSVLYSTNNDLVLHYSA